MRTLLDSEFLDGLRRRDPELLEEVVREHSRPLFRAARGMGFASAEAEDLVQEVFLTFLEGLDRFEGRSTTRTWLFGILHHKVKERRRELSRENQKDSIDDVIEARFDARGNWIRPPVPLDLLIENRELRKAIEECMQDLTQSQRDVFVLRDMHDLETEEVCEILGVTSSNMFVLTFRARGKLRECLEAREVKKR